MTAQFTEILHLRGEELSLCSQPLDGYLDSAANPIKFKATSTALWRGYVGSWTIENDRLYLTKLSGNTQTDEGLKKVVLTDMFPGYPDGVFAHWYTGEMRCPQGELLKYVHGGYASSYEKDLFIDVRQGVVVGERVVENGQSESTVKKGYVLAGLTNF
jgi:hypothetical protein